VASRTLRERLFSRLVIDPSGCLLWTGSVHVSGYGRMSGSDGKTAYVHRLMYELFVGPIPADLELDHLCRVRRCASPAHLEAVTHRINMLRGETVGAAHAAITHCPQGHPYDEANTGRRPGGQRYCRACNRERARQRSAS
jgi:hypothetical protein